MMQALQSVLNQETQMAEGLVSAVLELAQDAVNRTKEEQEIQETRAREEPLRATFAVYTKSEELLSAIATQKTDLDDIQKKQEAMTTRVFNKEINAFNTDVTKQKR
mmetsp:Transcript_14191/g.29108  ORF Transcript_14191/g.29108 Transcript_14191/m.29108 type:complete len:106 (+) Transcript_14191:193-510(+)